MPDTPSNPFSDYYAADDEAMAALAANDLIAYERASAKMSAALSRIKPPQVPSSWRED